VRLALTFDTEHPGRPSTAGIEQRLLDTLASAGVRGTFFLQGRWARAHPDQARRIAEAGHLIGNHSHHHAPMDALTDDGFRADVQAAEDTIRSLTGVDPKPWFRCPFGAGMDDAHVLGLLAELGYRHVGWDADPRDWEEGRTNDELVERVLQAVRDRNEAIVLLHSWPDVTANGLPRLLEALADAEFVDVSAFA
jgi:peptidoglycan/xylan/chitin deacetylase (PgdA/CDA1 family)